MLPTWCRAGTDLLLGSGGCPDGEGIGGLLGSLVPMRVMSRSDIRLPPIDPVRLKFCVDRRDMPHLKFVSIYSQRPKTNILR